MCEQCDAKTDSYLSPLPGWYLVRATVDGDIMKAGDWGLLVSNDPDFVWSVTPRPDPGDDDPDSSKWLDDLDDFDQSLGCSPIAGYELVSAALKVGYDPSSGSFVPWLFNYLGEWISKRQPFTHGKVGVDYTQSLIDFGYVVDGDIDRPVGKFYKLVTVTNEKDGLIEAKLENEQGDEIVVWDLKEGTLAMLISTDGSWCNVLIDSKIYKIHRIWLTALPENGENDDGPA